MRTTIAKEVTSCKIKAYTLDEKYWPRHREGAPRCYKATQFWRLSHQSAVDIGENYVRATNRGGVQIYYYLFLINFSRPGAIHTRRDGEGTTARFFGYSYHQTRISTIWSIFIWTSTSKCYYYYYYINYRKNNFCAIIIIKMHWNKCAKSNTNQVYNIKKKCGVT